MLGDHRHQPQQSALFVAARVLWDQASSNRAASVFTLLIYVALHAHTWVNNATNYPEPCAY